MNMKLVELPKNNNWYSLLKTIKDRTMKVKNM